jgi:hypothetical protein
MGRVCETRAIKRRNAIFLWTFVLSLIRVVSLTICICARWNARVCFLTAHLNHPQNRRFSPRNVNRGTSFFFFNSLGAVSTDRWIIYVRVSFCQTLVLNSLLMVARGCMGNAEMGTWTRSSATCPCFINSSSYTYSYLLWMMCGRLGIRSASDANLIIRYWNMYIFLWGSRIN